MKVTDALIVYCIALAAAQQAAEHDADPSTVPSGDLGFTQKDIDEPGDISALPADLYDNEEFAHLAKRQNIGSLVSSLTSMLGSFTKMLGSGSGSGSSSSSGGLGSLGSLLGGLMKRDENLDKLADEVADKENKDKADPNVDSKASQDSAAAWGWGPGRGWGGGWGGRGGGWGGSGGWGGWGGGGWGGRGGWGGWR